MIHKALIGNNYGLGKAIHAFSNFNKDIAIVNKRGNIALFHDGVRYLLNRYANVFIMVKGCSRIYIFEIGSHESGIGCQDYAVEEDFESDEICSFSADITGVVD